MDEEAALALATELQTQGYIKPSENGLYNFTDKGEELVRASAAGKVKRQTAENALIGLLARVEQYNSNPNKLLMVEAVVVFGSFLPKGEFGRFSLPRLTPAVFAGHQLLWRPDH